jgi:hypothetical protein
MQQVIGNKQELPIAYCLLFITIKRSVPARKI